VLVSEDDEVLDGHHRMRIAADLGLSDVPIQVVTGLSPAEKRALAIDVNLKRRHLTARQKRALVAQKLKADPTRSNNSIAKEVGVDDKTAGAVRADLEASSEIPMSSRRRGRDGRTCSVKSPAVNESRPATSVLRLSRGDRRGSCWSWPDLEMLSREAKGIAEHLMSLRRLKPDLEAVQKIAGQLRQLAVRLEEMVASAGGPGQDMHKDA
jgi:ParB-like chromosome segregation protein Spo0J